MGERGHAFAKQYEQRRFVTTGAVLRLRACLPREYGYLTNTDLGLWIDRACSGAIKARQSRFYYETRPPHVPVRVCQVDASEFKITEPVYVLIKESDSKYHKYDDTIVALTLARNFSNYECNLTETPPDETPKVGTGVQRRRSEPFNPPRNTEQLAQVIPHPKPPAKDGDILITYNLRSKHTGALVPQQERWSPSVVEGRALQLMEDPDTSEVTLWRRMTVKRKLEFE